MIICYTNAGGSINFNNPTGALIPALITSITKPI